MNDGVNLYAFTFFQRALEVWNPGKSSKTKIFSEIFSDAHCVLKI